MAGLDSAGLLSLVDEMRKRGVLRFTLGAATVEFAQSTIGAAQHAERQAREAAAIRRVELEAGGAEQLRKREAGADADTRLKRSLASV